MKGRNCSQEFLVTQNQVLTFCSVSEPFNICTIVLWKTKIWHGFLTWYDELQMFSWFILVSLAGTAFKVLEQLGK
jgi:hypothetical protein